MLLGVLDIGSNSAQLQVFEARPGAPPLPTHAVKEPTLLSGAGRLTRLFLPDDPPSRDQLAALRRHVNGTLREREYHIPAAGRSSPGGSGQGRHEGPERRVRRHMPVGPARGIILHYLQAFNQSFDLPLRPLNGSAYGQGVTGGRHVTLVTTSSGQA